MALLSPRRRTDAAARHRVGQWTRQQFGLDDEAVVMVAQVECDVPGCPPIETVVAFWGRDGTRYRFKVFKPVDAVAEEDIPFRWLLPALIDEDALGLACC